MNQPRPLLAMLICLALFLVWSVFSSRQQQRLAEKKKREQENAQVQKQLLKAAEPVERAPGEPAKAAAVPRPARQRDRREIRAGDRFHLTFTTRGGAIERVVLPQYKSSGNLQEDFILLPENPAQPAPLAFRLEELDGWPKGTLPALDEEDWEMEAVGAGEEETRLVFRNSVPAAANAGEGAAGEGDEGEIAIVKEVRAATDGHHLDVTVTIHNRSAKPAALRYQLWGPVGIRTESFRSPGADLSVVWGRDAAGGAPAVAGQEVAKIPEPREFKSDRIFLVGLSNNYFAAVLAAVDPGGAPAETVKGAFAEAFPDPESLEKLRASKFPGRPLEALTASEREEIEKKAVKTARLGIQSQEVKIAPGSSEEHRYLLYLGPRQDRLLQRYDKLGLAAINDYGWTSWVVKLFLLILSFFHTAIQSVFLGRGELFAWGLSIACLTLLVRLSLHPINRKQQLGMIRFQKQTQKIQPQMQEIRERYKDNRVKMQQEMQRLFKEHNYNPAQMMGGCLMVFLQLPIWIGLIRTLDFSLDLRQAPFLWIKDLSQPDRLFHIPHAIWFLPNDLNVLPVIYVLLMIVQQKLQPKPTDPQAQQTQRMMSIMMIAFGFIFYSFPSGLMVYFLTSAVFGIFESRYIKRIASREAPSGSAALPVAAAASPPAALYPASKAALKIQKPPKPKPFYRF